MHARERVIREHFAGHDCSHCGQPQIHAGVLVLARRRDTWLVLVTCPRCDHRGIFVVSFPPAAGQSDPRLRAINPADLEVRALSPESLAAALPEALVAPVITWDDVLQMRTFLQSFDGDFQRAFAEP